MKWFHNLVFSTLIGVGGCTVAQQKEDSEVLDELTQRMMPELNKKMFEMFGVSSYELQGEMEHNFKQWQQNFQNWYGTEIPTKENLIDFILKETAGKGHTYRPLPPVPHNSNLAIQNDPLVLFEYEAKAKKIIKKNHFFEEISRKKLAQLTPEELLLSKMVLQYFKSPENRKELGRQIYGDLRDRTTEWGGGIYLQQDRTLWFRQYPVTESGNNKRIVFPVMDAERLVATYHFHANKENNSKEAGPSGNRMWSFEGDISLGTDLPGVVMTKIPGNSFNSDIYFPKEINWFNRNAVVLDLGNYRFEQGKLK